MRRVDEDRLEQNRDVVTALNIIGISLILGLLPAWIANRKGHSFIGWWLFGSLLWIVALPAALIIRDGNHVPCPVCRERVHVDARACPHCQREIAPTLEA